MGDVTVNLLKKLLYFVRKARIFFPFEDCPNSTDSSHVKNFCRGLKSPRIWRLESPLCDTLRKVDVRFFSTVLMKFENDKSATKKYMKCFSLLPPFHVIERPFIKFFRQLWKYKLHTLKPAWNDCCTETAINRFKGFVLLVFRRGSRSALRRNIEAQETGRRTR